MPHRHKALLLSMWPAVLFLVWFNNFDWITGFYWSYTLLLRQLILTHSCFTVCTENWMHIRLNYNWFLPAVEATVGGGGRGYSTWGYTENGSWLSACNQGGSCASQSTDKYLRHMYYVTCLHVANLCMNWVVGLGHGEFDKQSIMVGSPQLASDRAIHLHGGKIHLT